MRNNYQRPVFPFFLFTVLLFALDSFAQPKNSNASASEQQKAEPVLQAGEDKKERKTKESAGEDIVIADPAFSLYNLKHLNQIARDKMQAGESVFDQPVVMLLSRKSIASISEDRMLGKMLAALPSSENGGIPCVVVKDDLSLPVAVLFNGLEAIGQFLSFPQAGNLSGLLIPNPDVLINNLSTKQELFASPKLLYGWIISQNLNVKSYLQKPRAVGSTESPSLPVSE